MLGSNFPIGRKVRFCDLRERNDVFAYFLETRPQIVFHTGAVVGGIKRNLEDPVKILNDNLRIDANVLEAAKALNVKCLVSYLSTCAFPDNLGRPFKEDDILQGSPYVGHLAYGMAKRVLYTNTISYRQNYGSPFYCLAPCNLMGPGDNFDLNDSHVVAALIRKAHTASQDRTDLEVWGDGRPLREFLYTKDLVDISMRLASAVLDQKDIPPMMIVSPGTELSIYQMAKTIAHEFGVNVRFDPTKPNGQFRKTSDASLLRSVMSGFDPTTFLAGVRKIKKWYLENYPNIRGVEKYD